MGAYLSHPKTDKTSSDQFNDLLAVGASSMQGWRNSQEDAHNFILNFDTNTSFFAVYDGHGGAEVAQYCADKLPDFLKNLETYKDGQFEVALKEAFLGFDKTLLDPSVVNILKILAGEHNFVDAEAEDYEEEDLAELQEESKLPLNEVLEKYKGLPQEDLDLKNSNHREIFKMHSPYFRGRRAAALAAEATNKAVMDPSAKPDGSSTSAAAAASALSVDGVVISRYPSNVVNPKAATVGSKTSSINNLSGKNAALKDDSINDQNEGSNGTGFKRTSSNSKLFETGPNDITDINSSQEDEFTDDDADYEENDIVKSPDTSSESSDCTENDGDEDGNEDSDEEETDEDQMANDNFCANMIEEPGKDSGCTAVVCLLQGRDLYVANAGDSRCVISRNGLAIEMSIDHKPEDDEEASRIIKAGGRVTLDGRVNGGLNLSRALGDHAYKTNGSLPAEEQMISALPDVKKLIITPEDEFMILACDGIWNYMSSEEVVEFVRCRLKDNKKLSTICEELFDNCLAPNTMGDGTGCDNMTAVIVQFKKKLQELQSTIHPNQSEDKLLKTSENVSDTINDNSAPKRCASQNAASEDAILEKYHSKRLKTELDPAKNISRSASPNSQNEDPGKKAIKEVTITVSSS
ncbi:probable protein phosphatase CG10417 [Drosophila santomea]|uniref:probable protein phosphatase CG10417 n=1 Tax=Drosophila santomea TaxID=129105 RepID=UPI00195393C8|nr:probable protein phosphatase CG10417 [Drosophila santomea]